MSSKWNVYFFPLLSKLVHTYINIAHVCKSNSNKSAPTYSHFWIKNELLHHLNDYQSWIRLNLDPFQKWLLSINKVNFNFLKASCTNLGRSNVPEWCRTILGSSSELITEGWTINWGWKFCHMENTWSHSLGPLLIASFKRSCEDISYLKD